MSLHRIFFPLNYAMQENDLENERHEGKFRIKNNICSDVSGVERVVEPEEV